MIMTACAAVKRKTIFSKTDDYVLQSLEREGKGGRHIKRMQAVQTKKTILAIQTMHTMQTVQVM